MTSRVAQVLGVHGGLDELVAALEQREVLLVLDNCEHVVESTATLVTRLLSECAGTVVLATSRAPLDVDGEVHYHVPPLEVPRRGADVREAQTTDAVAALHRRVPAWSVPASSSASRTRRRSSSCAPSSRVSRWRSNWRRRGYEG